MNQVTASIDADTRWKSLYRIGGAAAWTMLALIPIQIAVFAAYPPPATVTEFFALFQNNALLGLLSLDLLYILNNILLSVIYLALFFALKRGHESLMVIALALGMIGIAAYFPSNTAFEMLTLSGQYAAAANDAQRALFLAAGEAMLAIYRGTTFNVYYVLNAAALLLTAVVMLRGRVFGKAAGRWGLAAGILMIIPSTAGALGLVFSLLSLLPWSVFCVLVAKKFALLGRA